MDSPASHHPVYRAYILSPTGAILIAHPIDCDTDEQAIRKAQEYATGNAVELWDRGRKVAIIPLTGRTE